MIFNIKFLFLIKKHMKGFSKKKKKVVGDFQGSFGTCV